MQFGRNTELRMNSTSCSGSAWRSFQFLYLTVLTLAECLRIHGFSSSANQRVVTNSVLHGELCCCHDFVERILEACPFELEQDMKVTVIHELTTDQMAVGFPDCPSNRGPNRNGSPIFEAGMQDNTSPVSSELWANHGEASFGGVVDENGNGFFAQFPTGCRSEHEWKTNVVATISISGLRKLLEFFVRQLRLKCAPEHPPALAERPSPTDFRSDCERRPPIRVAHLHTNHLVEWHTYVCCELRTAK